MTEDGKMSLDELRKKLAELGVLKEGEASAKVDIPRDITADELDRLRAELQGARGQLSVYVQRYGPLCDSDIGS